MLERTEDKIRREENVEKLLTSQLDDFESRNELEAHNTEEVLMSVDQSYADYKVKFEESKVIHYPDITPIGMTVITSSTLMNIMDQKHLIAKEDFSLELLNGLKASVSDVQTVVAVGPDVRQVKVGDLVKIRLKDFERMVNPNTVNAKETFELPTEIIDGRTYLDIHERNIKYKYGK